MVAVSRDGFARQCSQYNDVIAGEARLEFPGTSGRHFGSANHKIKIRLIAQQLLAKSHQRVDFSRTGGADGKLRVGAIGPLRDGDYGKARGATAYPGTDVGDLRVFCEL